MNAVETACLRVSIPVCSFRRSFAREYLETERFPPPSTVYGFLLSLVGEEDRKAYVGAELALCVTRKPEVSRVLRTAWRVKESNYWTDPTGKSYVVSPKEKKKFTAWVKKQGWPKPDYEPGLGLGGNARPDYQELLSGLEIAVWIKSPDELVKRVANVFEAPGKVQRFGGLSLGESRDLVDEVQLHPSWSEGIQGTWLVPDPKGKLPLTVWVDHVGSKGTRWRQFQPILGNVDDSSRLEKSWFRIDSTEGSSP